MAVLLGIKNGIPYSTNIAGIGGAYDQSVTLTSTLSGAFTLPNGQTYNVGNFELLVIVDGIVQEVGMDYTESSNTTITFSKTINAGQTIRIRR